MACGGIDMVLSNAERQRLWRQRRKEKVQKMRRQGRHKLEVWVSSATIKRIEDLQDQYGSVDRIVEVAIRRLSKSS
jgi:hypothetical protein